MALARSLTLIVGVAALALPAGVLACTPPLGWNLERARSEEDQFLRDADVFYRGVIESVDTSEAVDALGRSMPDKTIASIRRTRTVWGEGGRHRLTVPWGYLVNCPFPNLMEAYWTTQEGARPVLRPGWGVTVIGRREDFDGVNNRVFILIDGEPETARIVRRFQQVRLGWNPPPIVKTAP